MRCKMAKKHRQITFAIHQKIYFVHTVGDISMFKLPSNYGGDFVNPNEH